MAKWKEAPEVHHIWCQARELIEIFRIALLVDVIEKKFVIFGFRLVVVVAKVVGVS